MAPLYSSIAQLREALSIPVSDVGRDEELSISLDAACREIERATRRRFWKDELPSSRQYAAEDGCLFIDDLAAVPTAVLDAASVAVTSYTLFPRNAAAVQEPYRTLVLPGRSQSWKGAVVTVTGVWGWPIIPPEVHQAAFLQAHRLFQRRTTPFGISGSPDVQGEMRLLAKLDPDVEALLKPLMSKRPGPVY